METTTMIWMVVMMSCVVGPFIYFATLAGRKEKTKAH